ncbi:MAG: serine/threonine protein kinase [Chloroflexi bacterium]|nr:serine/threonine protein kinase [Chloroflexota bacterium]
MSDSSRQGVKSVPTRPTGTPPFGEPSLVGTVLGPYRIEALMGYGGMSIVYRALQVSLQRPIALKLLPLDFARNPALVESFVQEARSAAALQHPNIIQIYDSGEINGHYFIAMRFVDGLPLARAIPEGGFPIDRAIGIIVQIASALDYAHARGVIHRDVGASNVMIEAGDRTTLMDFGIAQARASSRITRAGIAVGTLEYLAPERARGEASTPQSDIYSLGVLAFELLTGQLPYRSNDDQALLQQHLSAPIPSPRRRRPDIPPSVETAIQRCLAKQPGERFPSADTFAAALSDSLGQTRRTTAPIPNVAPAVLPVTRPLAPASSSTGATAMRPPSQSKIRPRERRRRFPWWAFGIILAVVLITLGLQLAQFVASSVHFPTVSSHPSPVIHATTTPTPHRTVPTATPKPKPTSTATPIVIPAVHPTSYGAAVQGFYDALLTALRHPQPVAWARAYAYLSPDARSKLPLAAFEAQYSPDSSIAWHWDAGIDVSPTSVTVPTHLTEYRSSGDVTSNFGWVVTKSVSSWYLDHTVPLQQYTINRSPPGHTQDRS